MTAAPKMQAINIPVSNLRESPTNPRHTFKRVEELAEHIKVAGVTHPILVRPFPGDSHIWEIVCGHRRVRASKLAGLEAVPAIVRQLNDQQVVEVQLVELSQREDVHPLEEADGYQVLLKDHNLAEEEIAARVGCTVAHVKLRLKLVKLAKEVRKAYLAGELLDGAALRLARLPEQLQAEALKELQKFTRRDNEPASLRDADEVVTRNFLLELGGASFDTASATLVSKAGACTTCPKRTGNQTELFADVKSKDVCTDRACFALKTAAGFKLKAATAEAEGRKVLTKSEAAKVFESYNGTDIHYSSEFVDLDAECYEDSKRRTYRQLLKKAEADPEVVLAQDRTGAARELLKKDAAARALKKVIPSARIEGSRAGADFTAQERARQQKAKLANQVVNRGIERVLLKMAQKTSAKGCGEPHFDQAFFGPIVDGLLKHTWADVVKAVARRRGLEVKGKRPEELLKRESMGMNTQSLAGLMLELVITRGASPGMYGSGYGEAFKAALEGYDVDIHKLQEEVKGEAQEKKGAKGKSKGGVNR